MSQATTESMLSTWWTEETVNIRNKKDKFNLEILSILAGCVGVAGNSFAIIILVGYKRMRKRAWSSLLVNQCVIDLVASLITVLYHIGNMVIGDDFRAPYLDLAGELYCKLLGKCSVALVSDGWLEL